MQYLYRLYSDALQLYHSVTYQITCRRSLRFLLVEHFCTKRLTIRSSNVLPASKPHESWKTNALLLSNVISFSISCSPLCHTFSKVIVTLDSHYLCSWIEPRQVNLSTSIMLDHNVQNTEYLMTLPAENFRLFCCIANSLEDGCLPSIGTANDKDTKTPGELSNILCSSPSSFQGGSRFFFNHIGLNFFLRPQQLD